MNTMFSAPIMSVFSVNYMNGNVPDIINIFLRFKLNDFQFSVCLCIVFLLVSVGIGKFRFLCSFDV